MIKSKIAIVGYGTVGKAIHALFPNALIYNGEKHPVGQLNYMDIYAIVSFARRKGSPMKITEVILKENEKWRSRV